MKKVKILKIFVGVVLFSVSMQAYAQADADKSEVKDSSCIDVATIQTLTSVPISDAFDILEKFGYSLGDLSDTVYDTVDYFPLKYQRSIFYSRSNNGSYVLFKESLDGLSNCIVYTRMTQSNCNIKEDLIERNFVYNKDRAVYLGTMPNKGHLEQYEFATQQNNDLTYTCKAIEEIEKYVSHKKEEAIKQVENYISLAQTRFNEGQYHSAINLLDSVRGFYPPKDQDIDAVKRSLLEQREIQLKQHLDDLVTLKKYNEALVICDSITAIDPYNESVVHIHTLIVEYQQGNALSFKDHSPEVYNNISSQLQDILNLDIRTYAEEDPQKLSIHFTFHTDSINKSNGLVSLDHKAIGRRMARMDAKREASLQQSVDSLATLPSIKPYYNQDILAVLHNELNAEVTWRRYNVSMNHDQMEDSSFLRQYIDTIEHQYMYVRKVSKNEFNSDGSSKVISMRRLPTKCIYTFDIIQKNVSESTYLDVSLTDFETALAFSWIPSLIIPGLGTYQQGAHGSVISRALPFFVALGVTAGGFIYQSKVIDVQGDKSEMSKFEANAGTIIGCTGGVIAGTIYLTDIFEGIGNSIRNSQRSKALRKTLRKGPILLESQDVPFILQ